MEAIIAKKKLIEVALPLDDINRACVREKSIRRGHPSTLHLWWARRPLAAARAVIFAQMIDDPSEHPELFATEAQQEQERDRLFAILRRLVCWESTKDEEVLREARAEILNNWQLTCAENQGNARALELFNPEGLPAFYDPFAGGGSLPLEAQRLGLEAFASDLNPVAALINKAMIELPAYFCGCAPVHPEIASHEQLVRHDWSRASGLAEDVRFYGRWIRDEAERRIGQFYPDILISSAMAEERPDLKALVGTKATVIAWLWARTVKSPNPAFASVDVPLISTYMLATKPGTEAYIEPSISGQTYTFAVKVGVPTNVDEASSGTKAEKRNGFRCILSAAPITFEYIRDEAAAGRMSTRLVAVIAESRQGRIYLSASEDMERLARTADPHWLPDSATAGKCRVNIGLYGMTTWDKLFTPRQLVALTTFADLVEEVRNQIISDARAAKVGSGSSRFDAEAYANAICVYLAFAVSRMADRHSTLCRWDPNPSGYAPKIANTFGRQALPMVWDFVEGNPFSSSSGNFTDAVEWVVDVIKTSLPAQPKGVAEMADARVQRLSTDKVVSTDPPYFDNIEYADLSDFFYVWLRHSLRHSQPALLKTIATPKDAELVGTAQRHGSKAKAERFFLDGMTEAMSGLVTTSHPAFPVTIYYAFKQSTTSENGTTSTGWETFLEAVIRAGFAITATWPVRTELPNRMIGKGANALASSIVLACRPLVKNRSNATRRQFLNDLSADLPLAVAHLQRGNIAPVDLAQAAIGPGMAVFTRYDKIVDTDGRPLSIREALALINEVLDEVLAQQEGDFDAESRFAIAWFEQAGFEAGEFGVADVLARAKVTTVSTLVDTHIAESRHGKFRLLRPDELSTERDNIDSRTSAWKLTHRLINTLSMGGEGAAASIVAQVGSRAEIARELAYRLYTIAERKRRASDALSYNALVQSWPEIMHLSHDGSLKPNQPDLFGDR